VVILIEFLKIVQLIQAFFLYHLEYEIEIKLTSRSSAIFKCVLTRKKDSFLRSKPYYKCLIYLSGIDNDGSDCKVLVFKTNFKDVTKSSSHLDISFMTEIKKPTEEQLTSVKKVFNWEFNTF
jgi:hypothetical protein